MKECVSQLRIYLAIFKFNYRVTHFGDNHCNTNKIRCNSYSTLFFYIKPINKEKRVRDSHNFGGGESDKREREMKRRGLKQMREFFIDYIALFKEYIVKELNFNEINVLNRFWDERERVVKVLLFLISTQNLFVYLLSLQNHL